MNNAGPGIYDEACTIARKSTEASGVLLVVFGGEKVADSLFRRHLN